MGNMAEKEQSKRVTLQVNGNGRVTIPKRFRNYFELPEDLDSNDCYLTLEVKGLDPVKHPDHPMKADEGGAL